MAIDAVKMNRMTPAKSISFKESENKTEEPKQEDQAKASMSNLTKGLIGAGAVAVVVAAGIAISRRGKGNEAIDSIENTGKKVFDELKSFKERVIAKLQANPPKFEEGKTLTNTFPGGSKRVDDWTEVTEKVSRYYDKNNKITKEVQYFEDNNKVFSYKLFDRSGKENVTKSWQIANPNSINNYKYNKSGNMILAKYSSGIEVDCLYNGKHLAKVVRKEGGKITEIQVQLHNKAERPTKLMVTDGDGKFIRSKEAIYDESNKMISEVSINGDKKTEKIFKYYNNGELESVDSIVDGCAKTISGQDYPYKTFGNMGWISAPVIA